MKEIVRDRRLTQEEIDRYNLIRKQVEQEFPPMSFKGAFEPPCNYCGCDHSVLDCVDIKYNLSQEQDHKNWCERVEHAIVRNNHLMMKALYRQASPMIEHGVPYNRSELITKVNQIVDALPQSERG